MSVSSRHAWVRDRLRRSLDSNADDIGEYRESSTRGSQFRASSVRDSSVRGSSVRGSSFKEGSIRGSEYSSRRRKQRKHTSITVDTLLLGVQEYFQDKDAVDLTLPEASVPGKESRFFPFGEGIVDTFNLNRRWIVRVLRFFAFYAIGILFFNSIEGWTFTDCVYFITQT